MGRCVDLTGQKFGKLTVIKKEKSSADGDSKWLCECECGNSIIMRGASLRKTAVIPKSCGCLQKEFMRKRNKANKKRNTYDLNGDYGIGYSSNDNEPFYFDLEDYDKIKNYYWYSNHDGYMCSSENNKQIIMHRLIMDIEDINVQVDHFNRNRKDNRKENLKYLSPQHNNWNKGLQIFRRITSQNIALIAYFSFALDFIIIVKSGHRLACSYASTQYRTRLQFFNSLPLMRV